MERKLSPTFVLYKAIYGTCVCFFICIYLFMSPQRIPEISNWGERRFCLLFQQLRVMRRRSGQTQHDGCRVGGAHCIATMDHGVRRKATDRGKMEGGRKKEGRGCVFTEHILGTPLPLTRFHTLLFATFNNTSMLRMFHESLSCCLSQIFFHLLSPNPKAGHQVTPCYIHEPIESISCSNHTS